MSLSTRQKNLLEFMLSNPTLPETVCARQCGVPNSTYFAWKQKGEFTAELDRRIKEQWKDSERMATDQMESLAREGNFQAVKYILDNLGYKPIEKVQAEVNTTINISIDGIEEGEAGE